MGTRYRREERTLCPTTHKFGWRHKATAVHVQQSMHQEGARRPGHRIQPYRCHWCGLWHVGNAPVGRPAS